MRIFMVGPRMYIQGVFLHGIASSPLQDRFWLFKPLSGVPERGDSPRLDNAYSIEQLVRRVLGED